MSADSISYRRPLLTALRLGIIPGAFSRKQVLESLSLSDEEFVAKLDEIERQQRLNAYLERLEEVIPDSEMVNYSRIWKSLGLRSEKSVPIWDDRLNPKRVFAGDLALMFRRIVERSAAFRLKAPSMLDEMIAVGCIHTPCDLIYRHFFCHGLFGRALRPGNPDVFLSSERTEEIANSLALTLRERLLSGSLLPRLHDPVALLVIEAVGAWDAECRSYLAEQLEDERALISFVLYFYGGNYGSDLATIQRFYDAEKMVERCTDIIARPSVTTLHAEVVAALHKAASRNRY